MALQEKTKQSIVYYLLAFLIVIIAFAIVQFTKIFNKPSEYMIAKNGRITNYENVIAYVIRNEEILDTSDYEGERRIVIGDSNKVAQNDVVMTFIENEEDSVKEQLTIVNQRIQDIVSGELKNYSQELKQIDKKADNTLYTFISNREDFGNIKETKEKIENILYTKVSTIGDMSPKNSELRKLIDEKNEYEKNRYNYKKDFKVPKSGLLSYRVDGYENYLSPDHLSRLNLEYLKSINCITDQTIAINEGKVKLVDNFFVYLALITSSEEGKNVKLNDTLKVSLDGSISNYSRGNVEYIVDDDESDERIIVVKILDNTEYLSKYRKVSADIIWWNYEGIKIQNDAIYDVEICNEDNSVIANSKAIKVLGTTGYQKEILVKIESSTKDFSVISNYEDEELLEMGLSENYVNDRSKINLYDRVILN